MKVLITTYETFEFDAEKCKAEFPQELATTLAEGRDERAFLSESFWELLAPDRERDHLNKDLIRRIEYDDEIEFQWPTGE